jgi:hypothetical protein
MQGFAASMRHAADSQAIAAEKLPLMARRLRNSEAALAAARWLVLLALSGLLAALFVTSAQALSPFIH